MWVGLEIGAVVELLLLVVLSVVFVLGVGAVYYLHLWSFSTPPT